MARQRVAYTGDPEKDWRDVGPAAAGAVDGIAAVGRLSATAAQEYLQADVAQAAGAGPVERRRLTPEELAQREAANAAKDQLSVRERPGPAGSFTPRPRVEAAPIETTREETPMTVTAAAPPEIPCGSCIHEIVCGLKASIPVQSAEPKPITAGFPDGIRMFVSGYRIECDHFHSNVISISTRVTTQSAGEAERVAASRTRGTARMLEEKAKKGTIRVRAAAPEELAEKRRYPLPKDRDERDRVVLEAIRETPTVGEAAARLGVSPERVRQITGEMRVLGRLPDDVAELLRVRGRSGKGAVVASQPQAVPA